MKFGGYFSTALFSSLHVFLSFPLGLCLYVWFCVYVPECSWSQQALHAVNPVTPVICPSSAPAPALTAPPTSTCTTATPATMWMATVTTAFARLTSSSVSRCGAKVRLRSSFTPDALCEFSNNGHHQLFNVFGCVSQGPSQLQASASKGWTQQETLMATVARTPRAPLPNAQQSKTRCCHRNQWLHLIACVSKQ